MKQKQRVPLNCRLLKGRFKLFLGYGLCSLLKILQWLWNVEHKIKTLPHMITLVLSDVWCRIVCLVSFLTELPKYNYIDSDLEKKVKWIQMKDVIVTTESSASDIYLHHTGVQLLEIEGCLEYQDNMLCQFPLLLTVFSLWYRREYRTHCGGGLLWISCYLVDFPP